MSCEYKWDHVKVQIPDEDWKCPGCGSLADIDGDDGWTVEDCVNYDCELLHNSDTIVCEQCGFGMTGKEYSEWYAKKSVIVTCPCCNGSGVVDKKVAKKIERSS